MSDNRVIKKYPNRRLYDTEISKYITLEDVRKLVTDGVDFCVNDVKTGEDLTRNILLQIIAEQEHKGAPFFSAAALSQIIRFYDNSMQSIAGDFIQKSLALFVEQQHEMMQKSSLSNPLKTMNEIVDQNMKLWRDMQERFFKSVDSNEDRTN